MSEPEVFEVQCGACQGAFQIDATQTGSTVHCPHCESPAEIPSLAEITGEVAPVADQPAALKSPSNVSSRLEGKKKVPRKQKPQGKPKQPASTSPEPSGKESRGRIKATTARNSAKLLLKASGMFYYIATFVAVAWSIKVVGTLYPIVNTGRGSYYHWFIEATMTTALAATLIGLLIAVAELIVILLHIHQKLTNFDD